MLMAWGELVSLEQRPPPEREAGRFRVALDQAGPPVPCSDEHRQQPGDRFLGAGKLINRLLLAPATERDGPLDDDRHRHLKRVLAKNLCGFKSRKSTRVPLHKTCLLHIGLQEIIHVLSWPADPPAGAGGELPLANLTPLDWTKRSRFDLQAETDESRPALAFAEHGERSEAFIEHIILDEWSSLAEPVWEPAPAVAPVDSTGLGEVINTGPRGYCVFVDGAERLNVQVGVPVGLMENGPAMFLGTVRWLSREANGWRFGLKLLSPLAEVVEVFAFGGVSKGKGLLLPADPVLRDEPELLVLPAVFEVHTRLTIRRDHHPPQTYLGRIREQTMSFTRLRLVDPCGEG